MGGLGLDGRTSGRNAVCGGVVHVECVSENATDVSESIGSE